MAENPIPYATVQSRVDAKATGLKRYFTGKPCKNGHYAERLVSHGVCMECSRLERVRGRDRQAVYQRRYLSDPVNRAKKNKYYRLRSKTPKAASERKIRRERQRVALAGRLKPDSCEVCGRLGQIHFDHCHLTGKFRGWICSDCNIAVGRMREDAAALHKLADYIERHNADLRQGDWVAVEETRAILKDGRSNGVKQHG